MTIHPKSGHGNHAPSERNLLLRALSPSDYAEVIEHAVTVPLRLKADLIEPGEPIRYMWFPQSGMLSVVNDMQDGKTTIEVGVIGRDGVAGLAVFHGQKTQPLRTMVQVAGEARRLPAEAFETVTGRAPSLIRVLHTYTLAVLNQAGQQTACNRLHSLEQRCAKWLLTTHDHMDAKELPLTQELLAIMLGVRRPGVTVAAQALQDAGLISYRRGRISITDRSGLENVACECYGRMRDDYESLFSDLAPRAGAGPRWKAAQPV